MMAPQNRVGVHASACPVSSHLHLPHKPCENSDVGSRHLPIWEIHSEILRAFQTGNRLVLVAPTGSGKTTQVPQMLLDAGLAGDKRIVVLQPRRVAARTVAARVAWERQCKLGDEVGYQIRFDDQTSLGTRICFITEGILLRWLQQDRELRDVSIILFDEFHERNLLSDVALALVKQMRPDLKLAAMSATLDAEPVAAYLGGCPILISQGQMFPVELQFQKHRDDRSMPEQAAEAIGQILQAREPGDVLVFMPGMAEINATINELHSVRSKERFAAIPLHGELPPEDQDRAFAAYDVRKIVVATNVAETSVTIDGIRHVVDSGLARIARYDAERGISTLFVEEISRASADQRKGRAGRTAPGTCYRLWTESNHLNRPERNTPEIQRSDLAEVVLLLHSLHIRKAAQFDWLDKPDPQAVERAEKLLHLLGAIDPQTEELTDIGRQMLRLPMHPRYSRMLVEAAKYNCVPAAALCAALVSGRDLLVRLGREDKHIAEARELFEGSADSDFFTLMRAWQFARKNNFHVDTCRRYGIHAQSARQVEQTFEQILRLAQIGRGVPGEPPDEHLLRCIMTGFIDQLCVRRNMATLECELTEARTGTLMRESMVQNAPFFVAANIREIESRGGEKLTLLGLASAVKREWIESTFPQQITTRVEHLYDRTHKRVAAVKLVRFHDLVIHHEHQPELDPAASGQCLAEAHSKDLFELPLFNHDIKQFIARANLVHIAMPELEVPKFDAAAVQAALARAFHGLNLAKEAQAAPLRPAFLAHLPPEQLPWIDELAPAAIPWLGDKKLKLQYEDAPEAQVKLHECFPLTAHPKVCEGKVPVKLWLCAPDGKRLESTTDWPAFRSSVYPKLKPQLQKKYPGFTWL
jgi:ATP-dependent helicase HrpB